ncbi:MAG TPA: hypothetical protein PLN69_03315 [bacterium]|nr:hypothetical protein [bacterium]
MADESYAERIKDLIEETVDRVTGILDEFGEKAGDIVKDAADNERVDTIVEKVKEIRKDIASGTGDIVKSITNAIVDTGESISNLVKKDDDDDYDD